MREEGEEGGIGRSKRREAEEGEEGGREEKGGRGYDINRDRTNRRALIEACEGDFRFFLFERIICTIHFS